MTRAYALADLPDRIAAKIRVDAVTGCWLWQGRKIGKGYGGGQFNGRHWVIHRLVYTLLVEPIPDGLELDHVRKRGCVHKGERNFCVPLSVDDRARDLLAFFLS